MSQEERFVARLTALRELVATHAVFGASEAIELIDAILEAGGHDSYTTTKNAPAPEPPPDANSDDDDKTKQ